MAEANEFYFTYKEIVESLLRKQGISEGLWGISIEFGLGAINMRTGPGGDTLVPAGLLGVQRIGIRRYEEPNNLTVDAAELNRAPKGAKKAAAKKGGVGKKGAK